MKQWIRIPGLIAFVLFTGLIFLATWLYSGTWLKNSIENQGSNVHGAKVEVEDAFVGLLPFKFSLTQFQMADPDAPMKNVLQFERADIEINMIELLFGKVIIENIELTGLQFNTPRTTSGAIEQSDKTQATASEKTVAFDEVKPVNVQDILAKETLKTLVEAAKTKEFYLNAQTQFEQQWQALPNDQDFADYQAKYQAFEQVDIQSLDDAKQLTADLAALKLAVVSDKQELADFKQSLAQFVTDANAQNKALLAAPGEDWRYLSNKYALNQDGLLNASALLFGEEKAAYLADALKYYALAKPWIARFIGGDDEATEVQGASRIAGRTIYFSDEKLPAFLLKTASVSAILTSGNYAININEVTNDQRIRNIATTITAKGEQLKTMQSSTLSATIDQRKNADLYQLEFNNLGWQQANKQLLNSADLSVNMAVQSLDMSVSLARDHGVWSGKWQSDYNNVNWQNQSNGWFNDELNKALSTVNDFNLGATFKGSGAVPDIALRSNLDDKLSGVFKARLKEEQAKLEAKIKAEVDAQKDKALAELEPYKQKVLAYQTQFKQLEEKFSAQVEAKQKALEDKIANKMNSIKGAANEQVEKAKAEADAAKAKAAEEKRKAEDAAKKKAVEEAKKNAIKLPSF